MQSFEVIGDHWRGRQRLPRWLLEVLLALVAPPMVLECLFVQLLVQVPPLAATAAAPRDATKHAALVAIGEASMIGVRVAAFSSHRRILRERPWRHAGKGPRQPRAHLLEPLEALPGDGGHLAGLRHVLPPHRFRKHVEQVFCCRFRGQLPRFQLVDKLLTPVALLVVAQAELHGSFAYAAEPRLERGEELTENRRGLEVKVRHSNPPGLVHVQLFPSLTDPVPKVEPAAALEKVFHDYEARVLRVEERPPSNGQAGDLREEKGLERGGSRSSQLAARRGGRTRLAAAAPWGRVP
mmetsp:Transcript_66579/g.167796  ORF Transcript_66579/g.167796 Transcript_66579/m.167796 type:complete len:295 (-) Transcript_66579:3033-3917(-)